MKLDQEIQKSLDKIIEIERQRARIAMIEELLSETERYLYQRKRRSQGFPFDQLESIIRSGLSLLERGVRTGVDALFDVLDSFRQR